MGCNPSKESQVATGDTASTHNLPKRQSNVSIKKTTETVTEQAVEIGGVTENTEVLKSVQVNADDEKEGKFIAADCPDRYFSSRKDGSVLEGVIGISVKNFSDSERAGFVAAETIVLVEGEALEIENDVLAEEVGNVEDVVEVKKEEEGPSAKNLAELKEKIFVEELTESVEELTESEATTTEKINAEESTE